MTTPSTDQVSEALNFAANTIELCDDATMRADYMLDAGECAGIIRALIDSPRIQSLATERAAIQPADAVAHILALRCVAKGSTLPLRQHYAEGYDDGIKAAAEVIRYTAPVAIQPAGDAVAIGHIITGDVEHTTLGEEVGDWDIEFNHKLIETMPEFSTPNMLYEIFMRATPAAPVASAPAHTHAWESYWSSATNGVDHHCDCGAIKSIVDVQAQPMGVEAQRTIAHLRGLVVAITEERDAIYEQRGDFLDQLKDQANSIEAHKVVLVNRDAEITRLRGCTSEAAPAQLDGDAERLARAERALIRAGFQDLGGQEWKPPLGKPPTFIEVAIDAARSALATQQGDKHE